MTSKTWMIFIAVVVVLFGGLIYLSTKDNIDVSNANETAIQPQTESSGNIGDHVLGDAGSKVTLIEYGDFQCPGCASAYEPIKEVTEKYESKMAFVFRNFPLTTIHPNARVAAASAEAAGLNGKYWEMHDLLYANQSQWENSSTNDRTEVFKGFAAQIGLDPETFATTLVERSEDINAKINYDIALGRKAGVDSTPTFYLNGELVDELVKDGKLVPAGTEGGQAVWTDAELFDELLLQPAFKEAGIDISDIQSDKE